MIQVDQGDGKRCEVYVTRWTLRVICFSERRRGGEVRGGGGFGVARRVRQVATDVICGGPPHVAFFDKKCFLICIQNMAETLSEIFTKCNRHPLQLDLQRLKKQLALHCWLRGHIGWQVEPTEFVIYLLELGLPLS